MPDDLSRTHIHPTDTRAPDDDALAELLDLDARLAAPVLDTAMAGAADRLEAPVRRLVDLGAGTGTAALALAARFPNARVVAVDSSPAMLDRLRTAASRVGAADRVVGLLADLGGDWPAELARTGAEGESVDLAWAALSLHHAADAPAVLRRTAGALRPGGVLVVTEMSPFITLSPDDLGTGVPGLAGRVVAAMDAVGYPTGGEWTGPLVDAGFREVRRDEHPVVVSAAGSDGARYLSLLLERLGPALASVLEARDVEALDEVRARLAAGRSPVELSSPRVVWTAERPAVADAIVVGGGPAGLAAAVALGRSRRTVVLVDAGEPRNARAHGAHNVLGQEGVAPAELRARGRVEAEGYGVRLVDGRVVGASGAVDDFTVRLADGSSHRARRIIFATGLVDRLPDIPGVAEAWGRDVLHCPFCHGWEVRDRRIVVIGSGESFLHQVMLFRQLSEHVTLALHDAPEPTDEQWERLRVLGVGVVTPRVASLVLDGGRLRGLDLVDGHRLEADAVVVAPRFVADTALFEQLGGVPTETPIGRQIPSGARGVTEVPGVWSAGNAADPMAMVLGAAAAGVMAGAAVHGDLALADLDVLVDEAVR